MEKIQLIYDVWELKHIETWENHENMEEKKNGFKPNFINKLLYHGIQTNICYNSFALDYYDKTRVIFIALMYAGCWEINSNDNNRITTNK